jgi:hypothetical protein
MELVQEPEPESLAPALDLEPPGQADQLQVGLREAELERPLAALEFLRRFENDRRPRVGIDLAEKCALRQNL